MSAKRTRSFDSSSGLPTQKWLSTEPGKEDGIPRQNQVDDDDFDDATFNWASKPTKNVKMAKKEEEQKEEEEEEEEMEDGEIPEVELKPPSMSQLAHSFFSWYSSQNQPTEEEEEEEVKAEKVDEPFKSEADLTLSQLQEIFSLLPADNGDPQVLRNIYEAVSIGHQMLSSLEQTPYVQSIERQIFSQALSSLAASSQAHFLASPNFAESLSTLANFLYYRLTPPAFPPTDYDAPGSSSSNPNIVGRAGCSEGSVCRH
ncbi:hypothetical protein TYRP_016404 [Tyrophagus putrescentiae]|nr:hypothetical protein TYRP_016404 [Tyrophagus putrescentiae]